MQPDDEYPCKRQELHLICIIDTCYDTITEFVSKIVTKHSANLHPQSGWKSVIQLLSLCGRHPETKDQAVNVLIGLCPPTTIDDLHKKLLDYSEARKRGKRDDKHGRNAQDSNERSR